MHGLSKDEVSYHWFCFGLFWLQSKGGVEGLGGWKRLTRKRRRGCRSRWWGTGSGRRLPSAGPSSPVRRSRTCFYRGASPIFAPSVWSSPPTCCPLVWNQSRSALMLKSPPTRTSLFFLRSDVLRPQRSVSAAHGPSGHKQAARSPMRDISETKRWPWREGGGGHYLLSHSARFLIRASPSFPAACHSHAAHAVHNLNPIAVRRACAKSRGIHPGVRHQRTTASPAWVAASGNWTLTDWHSYHLDISGIPLVRARALRVRTAKEKNALCGHK